MNEYYLYMFNKPLVNIYSDNINTASIVQTL